MGANKYRVWHAGNDGSGSGLDADTVDGIQASSFVRSDANDTMNGQLVINTSTDEHIILQGSSSPYIRFREGTTDRAYLQFNSDNHIYLWNQQYNKGIRIGDHLNWYDGSSYHQVWNAGNDGSGSGLDADLLDGSQKSAFVLNNQNSGYILRFGSGGDTGHTSSSYPYAIFQEGGGWNHPYPDLRINYHTGIIMAVGAASYGGLRFQRDYNDATELMSIGNGDNNVRIASNIYINGNTYVGSNNYSFRNGNNANNLAVYSGTSGAAGISMYNSSSQHIFQLYGETAGYYGFLDGNWAGWDIRKLKNGALEIDPDGGGLHAVLHAGETSTSDSANTIVRRDGSGYVFANFFNAPSGDMGSTMPSRFYTSHDNYVRYLDYGSMRSVMNTGGMGRYNGREQSTSDSNYWTGSMGWGSTDFNTIFDYGSGSIDVWSNPSNQPSGTSHWVGSQHLHYTNVSSRYGHQIVVGAGNPDLMYVRGGWGGGFTSWRKILNDNNASSILSSSSILYIDVYSNGGGDRNQANSWAQSAVSIPNDCLYIIRFNYHHSYWVGNHTGTSHEDRRTVWYKNSSGSVYWAGVDRS